MAEESDRAQDTAGSDAAAVAIALGSHGTLDPRVAEFLAKQGRLVDLQADDLRREDSLRHWSLRVHHISDVLKLCLELAVALILVALVALIAGAVWSAASDRSVVIEAFSVPPDLAAQGLTGDVVASKLLDRLAAIQADTLSSRAGSSYASNWGDSIKVQIPDTGVSLGEVNRYLHDWLGHQTHISGEVYRTGSGIAIAARTFGMVTPAFRGKPDDIDALVQQVAESVYRATQPYRYAIYLERGTNGLPGVGKAVWTEGDARAQAVLEQLVATGDAEDRAWSYDGLSFLSTLKDDFPDAEAPLRKAIALHPIVDFYNDLSRLESALDHDEPEVDALQQAAAAAARGQDADMDPVSVAFELAIGRVLVSYETADYGAVLANARAFREDVAQRFDSLFPFVDGIGLAACAALHDSKCLAQHGPDAAARRKAALLLGEYQAGSGPSRLIGLRHHVPNDALIAAYTGDFKQAHALIAKTPLDCDLCVRTRGMIAALEHNWSGAAHWFAPVSARSPEIPFADNEWGEMLLRKGDLDGAIAKFAAADKIAPHWADPLEEWGEALIAKNRSDLALAKFEEANRYAPNWGRLHLKWGEALWWSGDHAGAQKQFARARSLDLTPPEKPELAKVSTHG